MLICILVKLPLVNCLPFFRDRLSAQDILSIHKVYDYAHQQLYGEGGGKVDAGGEKVESILCLEVLCGDKVRYSFLLFFVFFVALCVRSVARAQVIGVGVHMCI